ncbi:MAG TPA: hypothetical protein VFW73_02080 [Lacipirellulaceae bacterium]|nr:hypothetical protein [Lacipirellulaceae bacterium]
MLPRLRLFVKKRGTRRTGSRGAGQAVEGLLYAGLMAAGAYGLYWLIDRVVSATGAGWWPWFAMLIPVAVFVYGAAGLIELIWQRVASTERRAAAVRKATGWELPGIESPSSRPALPSVPAADVVTDSPGIRLSYRLPIDAASGWVSFIMAAVCLAWNTLVAVFVVQVIQMHRAGHPNWLLTWLMIPFVLGGIWTLIELGRQVLVNIAVGTTRVEISQHPFYPGRAYQGFVTQTGRSHVRWLQVQLVCDEQAIHQQGTDTRRAICRVYRATLFGQRKFDITPEHAFDATFEIIVPDSAMHSFVAPHNAVMWAILVRGRMARWGEFERRFPIYIYPKTVTSKLTATAQLSTTGS